MTLNDVLEYCESLYGSTEKMPFGETTLIYAIAEKMYILIDIEDFSKINVKCQPELAVELREKYEHVIPGYHMNKKHWNSILFPNSIPDSDIKEWIKHSYDLVFASLPKKVREEWK